jgi:hypothetical protein
MPDTSTPEERARRRADEWEGLWWHVAAYLVVNAFVWGLDWITGDGIQWAYWVTFPWLIGLLFHVAAYHIEIRGRDRKYQQFLQQELDREAERQPH